MSIYWKYVSSFVVNTTRISKIECNRILHCNPPIYDWKVTLKNGDVHNINESIFKKLDDFDLILLPFLDTFFFHFYLLIQIH